MVSSDHTLAVARKRDYMTDAQRKWTFLTKFDCSTIKTAGQFSTMVHVRASIPEAQTKADVAAWHMVSSSE